MLYSIVYFAIFFAIIAGLRTLLTGLVDSYGLLGVLGIIAFIAGCFALGFWIDRRWPELSSYPRAMPAARQRRIASANWATIAGMAVIVGLEIAGLCLLPEPWKWYWLVASGIAYWRWLAVAERYEEWLWEEGCCEPDRQYRGDYPPPPALAFHHRRLESRRP